MKRLNTTLALMLPLALAIGACDTSTGAETGTLSLLLTDAPGDVAEARVTIERIYLQPGEGEEDGNRVDLMTDPVTVDLITLADDVEALVEGVTVPTGFYEQLRVVVSAACIRVEGDAADRFEVYGTQGFDECGDRTGSLQTTSLGQTGIKVQLPGDGLRVEGGQQVLLLDFDVSQSFGHQAGASGRWVMHPVIRGAEIGLTSSIRVNLTAADTVVFPQITADSALSLGDFVAALSTEAVDQAFSDDDGDSVYTTTFSHLVPDTDPIDVLVKAREDVTDYTFTFDPESAEVTLTSGGQAEVSFTLTRIQPVD